MRPDERRAVPDLLLGRLGEPPGERVARRLAGERRGVGHVAQGRAARPPPRRARSRRGRRPAARPASRAGAGARRRSAPPASRNAVVPEAQLVAAAPLLADRPQQAVALLERPAVRRERRRRRPASRGRASWSSAARRSDGRADDRAASPRARRATTRSVPRRGPLARRADAVDPDPLARPAGPPRTGPDDRRPRASSRPDAGPRPGRGRCPSGSARRRRVVRCERPQPSRTIASSRLVLPAAFGPQTSCGPGPERRLERGVAPEVEQAERVEHGSSASTGAAPRPAAPRSRPIRTSSGPA